MNCSFNIKEQTRSVRDVVYEQLKKFILEGHFQPGYQLNERQLAQQFSISTTPLKEALRQLEQEGLIETRPRVGSFVSQNVMVSLEEINLVRSAVEGVAARLAAEKITDEEIKQFAAVLKDMEQYTTTRDIDKLVETNNYFHKLISLFAKNNYIAKQVEVTRSFDLKRVLGGPEEIDSAYQDHQQIYQCIIAHDPDGAEAAIRQHINRNAEFIRRRKKS